MRRGGSLLVPTLKPRVNVTLSQQQYELLTELGRLQGRSASSYLRQLLDGAEPMMRAILPALRASAQATEEQPGHLLQAAKEALETMVVENEEQIDLIEHLASHARSSGLLRDRADRSESEDRTTPSSPEAESR